MEPTNPDKYFEYTGTIEVNGKRGKGKIKKWFDEETGKLEEKIISFEPNSYD